MHGWSRIPLAALALALLAALAACGGGDHATTSPPPSPTPTATSTVTATVTATPTATTTPVPSPTPEPTPTAEPTPCDGIECLEPAPYLFEHRVWEPGERVDWESAAFVLETLTGRVHGYRAVPRDGGTRIGGYQVLAHGWISARATLFGPDRQVLIDREHGRVWWWPDYPNTLAVAALSDDHVLFRDWDRHRVFQDGDEDGYRYTLATRDGSVRTQFQVLTTEPFPAAFFSPDGRALVVKGGGKVYRMSVSELRRELLFESAPPEGWDEPFLRLSHSRPLPPAGQRLIAVEVLYKRSARPDGAEEPEYASEVHLFDWDGVRLSEAADSRCGGMPSPNGRYFAWEEGQEVRGPKGYVAVAWPAVVIASAETCEPLFRVRSAYILAGYWHGQWLSNSEGFVVGVAGGNYHAGGPGPLRYAIARLHPKPELVDLPPPPPDLAWSPGPIPAPTGNGRYFAYGFPVIYDAHLDRWLRTAVYQEATRTDGINNDYPFKWGATYEELHATFNFWDGAGFVWFPQSMPPRIEFPPFDDELGFRVARTASCLNLRKSADEESAVLSCLPDRTRLTLGQPQERTKDGEPYPSAVGDRVYVRTEDGLEGWVSSAYLDYD